MSTHLVVPHQSLAGPLIDRFQLKESGRGPGWSRYHGDGIHLALSTEEKGRCADVVADLRTQLRGRGASPAGSPRRDGSIWLLIGRGTHPTRRPGDAILAHRVTDQLTGLSHYPAILFEPPCPTDTVLTVGRGDGGGPGQHTGQHTGQHVCDRVASGFYATACRFSTVELIHCLVIIADGGPAFGKSSPDQRLAESMKKQICLVESLLQTLASFSNEIARNAADPPGYLSFLEKWHFTFSQRHQLRQLLQGHRALGVREPWAIDDLQGMKTSREVLLALRNSLDRGPERLK